MIREKWIVGMRNKLSELAMECDSSAAIERAKMTPSEREALQTQLRDAVKWIDKRIAIK